jgi:hypothetical protein
MMMNRQEIIQSIEAYGVKQQSPRHWLTQVSNPQQCAKLERALRMVTVVLFGLLRELRRTANTGLPVSPRAVSPDDIDAQRLALKAELGQMEDARRHHRVGGAMAALARSSSAEPVMRFTPDQPTRPI